jgi:aspartokinase-like uncharacterized kinase
MKNALPTVAEVGQLRSPKIVLKIGGSLLDSATLHHWLKIVAQFGDGQVIIVPGGALFADAVRQAQQKTNINDAVAHRLALLAMDQYGLLMQGLVPELATASSELEIAECGWQHRGIIWLPSKMVLADESIAQNWQVTSDSLSAWLANQLKAEHLMIVKSKSLVAYENKEKVSVHQLMADGLLDESFGQYCLPKIYQTWLVNKADYRLFEHGITTQVTEILKKSALNILTS